MPLVIVNKSDILYSDHKFLSFFNVPISPFLNKEDTKKTYTNIFCISPFFSSCSLESFIASKSIILLTLFTISTILI